MYWKSGEYPWYVLVPATICETMPWAATWEAIVAKVAAVVKDFIFDKRFSKNWFAGNTE